MTLVIDTIDKEITVALFQHGVVLETLSWPATPKLSEELIEKIKMLLEKHGLKFQDLEKIIAHRGPGGFNTLRIGVVTANTLSFALDIPIAGVEGEFSSLKELIVTAEKLPAKKEGVTPIYRFPPRIG